MKRLSIPLPMDWKRISEEAAGAADSALIRAKAIELLARREHSWLELRQKLVQRGFSSSSIELVLDQLMEDRLLHEGRYAELYVCSRVDRGYGPLRIAGELRERGIHVYEDVKTRGKTAIDAVRKTKKSDEADAPAA